MLVTGVEDPDTRAHGANEGLHLAEFERVVLAEALLLRNLAAERRRACPARAGVLHWQPQPVDSSADARPAGAGRRTASTHPPEDSARVRRLRRVGPW